MTTLSCPTPWIPQWNLSGFRKVSHFIYEDGEFLKAACGTFWWMSDAVTARETSEPKCRKCASSRRVKDASS